jgi:helix-hairpin-helix protein
VVNRAVGAVVLIGMICLGSMLGEWMIRVRQDAPDPAILSRADSVSAITSVVPPSNALFSRAPVSLPSSFLMDPLVFLSRAPVDSLDLLPGIGPVLAARIIAYRHDNGGFTSWDQVDAVKGIGPKMIARWQALFMRQ